MTTLADIQDLQSGLIRKALNYSVFYADYSAPAVDDTTLFDAITGALVPASLPTGYLDLGFTTAAGAVFDRSLSQSNVASGQSLSPTRIDPTQDQITMQVSPQETKLATLAVGTGAAASGIAAAVNGVVRIDKPGVPTSKNYRVFAIAQDTNVAAGPVYLCRWMPKAQITAYDNQAYAQGDDPIMWPLTFTALKDDVEGTDHSWIFGGEGWLSLLDEMGFTAGP